MNKDSINYEVVNSTIWLTKGDHFFFYCNDISDTLNKT